jgi:hypothetical protein
MNAPSRPAGSAGLRPSRDPIARYGHPSASCIRKRRYGRRTAQRLARTLNQQQCEPVKAYPCSHCRQWHVAHS